MVPQQGRDSTLAAEPGYFPGTDAAFRPNDQEDFAGFRWGSAALPRFQHCPQGPNRVLVQDDGKPCGLHEAGKRGGVDGGPHLGNPGAAR